MTKTETLEALAAILYRAGLTITEFAKTLEMSKGQLSNILTGKDNSSIKMLRRIAAGLGYEIEIEFKLKKIEE